MNAIKTRIQKQIDRQRECTADQARRHQPDRTEDKTFTFAVDDALPTTTSPIFELTTEGWKKAN